MPLHVHCCQEREGTQAGYLVTYGTRTMRYSIHFYTKARVLAPIVTFYDAKLQLESV